MYICEQAVPAFPDFPFANSCRDPATPTHPHRPISNTFTEIHARDLCAWVRILTRRHRRGSFSTSSGSTDVPAGPQNKLMATLLKIAYFMWPWTLGARLSWPNRAIQSGYNFMRNLNTQDMLILWRPCRNTRTHKQARYRGTGKIVALYARNNKILYV